MFMTVATVEQLACACSSNPRKSKGRSVLNEDAVKQSGEGVALTCSVCRRRRMAQDPTHSTSMRR